MAKNIFVGCGSNSGKNPNYLKAASDLGKLIVETENNLVFGGFPAGMMGAVYTPVKESTTSKVYATSVKAYEKDMKTLTCENVTIADTINKRKDDFINLSDMFLFLPGGLGTIDEFMGCLETKRGREHSKPIIIINIDGYFNPILNVLKFTVNEDFTQSNFLNLFTVVDSVKDIKPYLTK